MPAISDPRRPIFFRISAAAAGISVLAATVLGACQSAQPKQPSSAAPAAVATAPANDAPAATSRRPARAEKATRTPELRADSVATAPEAVGKGKVIPGAVNVYSFDPEPTFTPVDANSVSVAHILADLGADAAEWYQHVQTLSNPWFEGRAPGSDGIEHAAQYVQWWMQKYGLEPAFAEGSAANAENPWRQPFELNGGERGIKSSTLAFGGNAVDGKAATAMRNSGGGTVELPIAFVGYGIVEGKDGYASFGAEERLDGRIAVVMRGEPLNAEGKSLWGGEKFTAASSLAAKLEAIKSRGAAAIIVTEPPGYGGKKANLATMSAESLGGELGIPCFFASTETTDAILKASDAEGRGIDALRARADAGTKDAPATTVLGKDDALVSLKVETSNGNIVTHNVGGVLRGKGALASEWIVIGAHYDHVGYGKYGADPSNRGKVHPGADDNASGTGGMLMMAKRLARTYADAPADASMRSVLFLAFSAEEIGLNGSRAYIKNPSIAADKLDLMINLDMIGRLRNREITVGGIDTAREWKDRLYAMFEESGMTVYADPSGRGPSDHSSFYGAGVPVLFFFSGVHDVYHQPGDKGYSVEPRGIPGVLALVEKIALWRAADPKKLEYWNGVREQQAPEQAASGSDRGYAPVRLGIQPGLVEEGESGIKVEGVSAGTSAAEAGIQAGDVLLSWNSESLDSVGTMMTKLRATKPGDVVKMRILRENSELEIDVKMKASTGARRPQNE